MTTNVREVMWKEKKYAIPFDVNLEWDKGQEVEIRNRFSGEPSKFTVTVFLI